MVICYSVHSCVCKDWGSRDTCYIVHWHCIAADEGHIAHVMSTMAFGSLMVFAVGPPVQPCRAHTPDESTDVFR